MGNERCAWIIEQKYKDKWNITYSFSSRDKAREELKYLKKESPEIKWRIVKYVPYEDNKRKRAGIVSVWF